MIRVVLDTNILISALLQPKGLPAQVFLTAIAGTAIQMCVSGEIYAEYEEVIRRPRFKRSQGEINSTLEAIREKGFWVRPFRKIEVCTDPDDNIFLECAEACRAQFLITGNTRDFPQSWAGTRILSAREFLEALAENPG